MTSAAPGDIQFDQAADQVVLRAALYLPVLPAQLFPFFADAANLERLTPSWLRFEILTPQPVAMAVGARIDYRLRVHGLPLRWQSEITAWDPPHRFVDEQRRGPYRLWVHEHTFTPLGDGTLAQDTVRYRAPGGPLVDRLLVRRDLAAIFRYRQQQLQWRFCQA